jgi:alpha-tubulin suppressor-like RCC1 family protein
MAQLCQSNFVRWLILAVVLAAGVHAAVPEVTSVTLLPASLGREYMVAVQANGSPTAWNLSGGALPPGLVLDATTGLIAGVPSASGRYEFQVVASNADGPCEGSLLAIQVREPRRLVAWGGQQMGMTLIPSGSVEAVDIASGPMFVIALRVDGTLVSWGATEMTYPVPPAHLSGIAAIAAGEVHCLALRTDGTVIAWGDNTYGQTEVPPGLSGITAIACGSQHSMALKHDGSVVCWGHNGSGRATAPSGLARAMSIACGAEHSAALLEGGTIAVWGGQSYGVDLIPVDLGQVTGMGSGDCHMLAVRSDGSVAAWGVNHNGQCQVPNDLADVIAVAGGNRHSLAIKTDGTVIAWGANDYGQCEVPPGLKLVTGIDGGSTHTVGLGIHGVVILGPQACTVVAGQMVSLDIRWDSGEQPTFSATALPSGLEIGSTNGVISGVPDAPGVYVSQVSAATSDGSNVAALAIEVLPARIDTYALPPGLVGTAYERRLAGLPSGSCTWALASGQLPEGLALSASGVIHGVPLVGGTSDFSIVATSPYGSSLAQRLRLRVNAPTALTTWGLDELNRQGLHVAAISCGHTHNLALLGDGTALTWGDPTRPHAQIPIGLSGLVDVAAGTLFSLALHADGTVSGWGGVGGYGEENPPADLADVASIAAGGNHALALREDGTVVGWGDDSSRQATPPHGLAGVVAIAAGDEHSLALRSDGTVVAWGDNYYGECTVPPGLTGVVGIAAGSFNSFAVKANGEVVAWGTNSYGTSDSPEGLSDVIAIACRGSHVVAVRADGTVIAWGSNAHGQSVVPAGLIGVTAASAGGCQSAALGARLPVFDVRPAWAVLGLPYELRVPATEGPNIYGATGLPSGLTLDAATGLISGIPTMTGLHQVQLTAQNSSGIGSATLALDVVPVAISTYSLVPGLQGYSYSAQLHAQSPTGVSWSIASGVLPVGLTLDPENGVISGTPEGLGDYQFAVQARSAAGIGREHPLRLRINGPGPVVAWGVDQSGETLVPADLKAACAVAGGYGHSVAIRADGTVTTWGSEYRGREPAGLVNVRMIACGDAHSLALTSEGRVVGWGDNYYGQTTIPAGLDNVTSIAAGGAHSVALRGDGSVVAWGLNDKGQTSVPAGLACVTAIGSGIYHTLAVHHGGEVACWGSNEAGVTSPPVDLTDVIAVSGGYEYSMALRDNGTVVTWGSGASAIVPPGLTHIRAIAGGPRIAVVLRDDQTVGAWGLSAVSPPAGLAGASAVGAGGVHGLAVGFMPPVITSQTSVDAAVGCLVEYRITATFAPTTFGVGGLPAGFSFDPDTGIIRGIPTTVGAIALQLEASNVAGTGMATLTVRTFAAIMETYTVLPATVGRPYAAGIAALSQSPAQWSITSGHLPSGISLNAETGEISGTPTAQELVEFDIEVSNAAGSSGPRRLRLEARAPIPVVAWGRVDSGQCDIPPDAAIGVAVAAGGTHTLALLADGTVRAWGANQRGQSAVPSSLHSIADIAAGAYFSLVLAEAGTVIAWGADDSGQSTTPSGLTGVTAVSAGDNHALALRGDGTVVAWGGLHSRSDEARVPAGLTGVVAISAGASHSLALRYDGTLVAWGDNTLCQTEVPADLGEVVAISAGGFHNLALQRDGTVRAWGWNGYGETTIPAPPDEIATAVSAGDGFSLAIAPAGHVNAWGSNGWYQTDLPSGLSFVEKLSAGWNHSAALGWVVPELRGYQPIVVFVDEAFTHHILSSYVPETFSSSNLPAWANLDGLTGVISGLPDATGLFSFDVVLRNRAGESTSRMFISVLSRAPVIITAGTVEGRVGTSFSYQVAANHTPTIYRATGMPPGLHLDSETGLLTGTPQEVGTWDVALSAENAGGIGTATLRITILPETSSASDEKGCGLGGLSSLIVILLAMSLVRTRVSHVS